MRMEKKSKKFSELLYGSPQAGKQVEAARRQAEVRLRDNIKPTILLDVEKSTVENDLFKLLSDKAQALKESYSYSVVSQTMPDGRVVFGFDPAGYGAQSIKTTPITTTSNRFSKSSSFGYTYPRGYGKTTMMNSWADSMGGLGKAAEEASSGLEELRKANAVWEAKLKEASDAAREAVSDERVREFMDQYLLPHDYARNLLEEAYKDSILNERGPDGEE